MEFLIYFEKKIHPREGLVILFNAVQPWLLRSFP